MSENTIKNVEIFRVGTHNGAKFKAEDLDNMVDAAGKLDFMPAVKVGHTSDKGAPAYGYLRNIRRQGDVLLGDLTDLTADIFKSIKQKLFGRVSVEMYTNFKRAEKTYPHAISAIALLGQEIPAVANLKPLYDSFGIENAEPVHFDFNFHEVENMSEDKAHFTAQLETMSAKVAQLESLLSKADEMAHDKFSVLEAKNAKLEAALSQKVIDEKTVGLLPAVRPYIKALYEFAMIGGDTVKVFSVGDSAHVDMRQLDVIEKLAAYMKTKADGLFSEQSTETVIDRKDAVQSENPSIDVDAKVREFMAKSGEKSYAEAMKKVLAGDKDLSAAYFAIQE